MHIPRRTLWIATLALAALWGGQAGLSGPSALAQQPASASPDATMTIRAESRLVLVDTVVTDKKGNYLSDLKREDFRVWEDDKEQQIKSFSFEAKPAPGTPEERHYLVLFFDNSTMQLGDQINARQAAAKFIAANAGPNRLMAIVEFTGVTRIVQNFTPDAARLARVVGGIKNSAVDPNASDGSDDQASLGTPSLHATVEAEFGQRNMLLALRTLAMNMANVPGRKSLVLLTAGFPLSLETMSELTATVNACNKANVAIYPIDVRGLVGSGASAAGARLRAPSLAGRAATLQPATFHPQASGTEPDGAHLVYVLQRGGSGGTGGGGGSHGGTPVSAPSGGGRPTGPTAPTAGRPPTMPNQANQTNQNRYYNQSQTRSIIPPFPPNATTNQQVLFQLASGTGGFVIGNTNDLLEGLDKIAHEQDQYYLLGYTPEVSKEGSCHTLKVKVGVEHAQVRFRSGYCNVRPVNLLAGKPIEKLLEDRANGSRPGELAAKMELPYFYTSANTARVNLAMELPTAPLKFEKQNGKEHAAINVLGLAYKSDGTVAARFSDTVTIDLADKKEIEEFQKRPYHYENQFGIGSGQYTVKLAFSSGGESYGKLEAPLVVDPYDIKQFSLSGLVLSRQMQRAEAMAAGVEDALLSDRTPLVVLGMQVIPTGDSHFKKTDLALMYAEIYEPLQVTPPANPLQVQVAYVVVDRKSGAKPVDTVSNVDLATMAKEGNPVIPIGLKLPVQTLPPGSYRAELTAKDNAGHASALRTVEFEVE
jgi:VWFA-related protein